MKLAIGCDEAGFQMKETIKTYLAEKGNELQDVGAFDENPVLYPDIAAAVAKKVRDGEAERGILICGTGIGMAMTANKIPGIRAAVCHDVFSTERSVKSNNAQILCMGARVIGIETAKKMVDVWMDCTFVDGPSTPKVERITYYETK